MYLFAEARKFRVGQTLPPTSNQLPTKSILPLKWLSNAARPLWPHGTVLTQGQTVRHHGILTSRLCCPCSIFWINVIFLEMQSSHSSACPDDQRRVPRMTGSLPGIRTLAVYTEHLDREPLSPWTRVRCHTSRHLAFSQLLPCTVLRPLMSLCSIFGMHRKRHDFKRAACDRLGGSPIRAPAVLDTHHDRSASRLTVPAC